MSIPDYVEEIDDSSEIDENEIPGLSDSESEIEQDKITSRERYRLKRRNDHHRLRGQTEFEEEKEEACDTADDHRMQPLEKFERDMKDEDLLGSTMEWHPRTDEAAKSEVTDQDPHGNRPKPKLKEVNGNEKSQNLER